MFHGIDVKGTGYEAAAWELADLTPYKRRKNGFLPVWSLDCSINCLDGSRGREWGDFRYICRGLIGALPQEQRWGRLERLIERLVSGDISMPADLDSRWEPRFPLLGHIRSVRDELGLREAMTLVAWSVCFGRKKPEYCVSV